MFIPKCIVYKRNGIFHDLTWEHWRIIMRKSIVIDAHIIRDFFSFSPGASVCILSSMVINALYPGITSLILANLFDCIFQLPQSKAATIMFWKYILAFILAFLIKNLSDVLINTPRSCGIYTKAHYSYERALAYKASKLPYRFFESKEKLEMLNRAQQAIRMNIPQRIFLSTLEILSIAIGIAGTLLVLANFNIWLVPIALLSIIPDFLIRIKKGQEYYQMKWRQAGSRNMINYLESLFLNKDAIAEGRVYKSHQYIYAKWEQLRSNNLDDERRQQDSEAYATFIGEAFRISGLAFAVILIIILLINRCLSIGQLAASISAFTMVQVSFQNILKSMSEHQRNISFMNDYYSFSLLDEAKYNCGCDLAEINQIKLDNVSFSYPDSRCDALQGINMEINKNEKIAIVGANGSGKTTLVKVLLGFLEPANGLVLVNKEPLAQINKTKYWKKTALVLQNFIHYVGTVEENVGIANTEKYDTGTSKRIISIILDKLEFSQDSIDRKIGKDFGTAELSGGEWQKLAIARVLYRDSEFVILDEPTASLDPMIEAKILNSFIDVTHDKTSIIISHRIGVCKSVDRIYVMDHGKIVESGSHAELMQQRGKYYSMFNAQSMWYN